MTSLELLAIVGMAVATWLTRTLPLMLPVSGEALDGFGQRFLQNLPAAILAALISPRLVEGDPSIWISALVTLALVWRFRNVLVGVAAGTACCALIRWLTGAFI